MRRAWFAPVALAAAVIISGCSPAPERGDAPSDDSLALTADWDKPLSVCKALTSGLVDSLLDRTNPDDELTIDANGQTTSDSALPHSSVSCTFSYGGGAQRLSVAMHRYSNADDALTYYTGMRNEGCDMVDATLLVSCPPDDAIDTLTQHGPVLVEVSSYFWQQLNIDGDDVIASMQSLQADAARVLETASVITAEPTTSAAASPPPASAPSASLGTENWADACLFSYDEIRSAFAWAPFTASSAEDGGTWLTNAGKSWYAPGCDYGPPDYTGAVISVTVEAHAYGDGTFPDDRRTAFEKDCDALRKNNASTPSITVSCEPGTDVDLVFAGGWAHLFRDDFIVAIEVSGVQDDQAFQSVRTLANSAAHRPLGDAR